jgi:hypothetical protein
MPFVTMADALVCKGNGYVARSWQEAFKGPIYPINNYGFTEIRFVHGAKDFTNARTQFLFLASGSQMQKGLDLLLEIFPRHPDLHLYICSSFRHDSEFCACYHRELFETANVHPIGWITVTGPRFYELVERCAYVILPSCSEGQAGSVVHCMAAGLLPLVTREAGIDTKDFGITFADDSLETIDKVVDEVARLPEQRVWL